MFLEWHTNSRIVSAPCLFPLQSALPMDRKLHMPEILDLIFAHLEPRHPLSSTMSKTLAALARTCTTFQDPALNALWAHQTSLVPALRYFPEDLWDRSGDSRKLTFVDFRRPLVPADWERALFYWKRIKSFRIESLDGDRISPDIINMLRICCPAAHLFPNLRKVAWLDENPADSFLL
ncbi:hypothetical protein MSAN_00099100 [Mycena sanguinolenta]|uniref:F-box domain-containing protein n=1 Tax=Mycena sanguinolenta TaxID=230812 RepID=A0A8H6ZFL7_9AGAR|nr:hypothetical protein MSAN_00099100 [Mycena sanguinolenta]